MSCWIFCNNPFTAWIIDTADRGARLQSASDGFRSIRPEFLIFSQMAP